MQYFLGDIPIKVEKKKIKNLHLYVKPPYGDVLLTAPKYVSDRDIEEFISERADWIIANVKKIQSNPVTPDPTYETGDVISVWGELYKLNVLEDTRYSLTLNDDGTATLIVRADSTVDQREAFMLKWYRDQLSERVDILLPQWEEYTGLKSNGWQSKNMKSRWGTCNTKTNKIWLNVRLAEHPVECLEYVILHELAHTKVPNHGADFKAILNTYMPNWKEVKKILNNKGDN